MNLNKTFKKLRIHNLNFYLPLVIIFSSLKINGYVLAFLFLFLYLTLKIRKVFDLISIKSIDEKIVSTYFIYLIIETFHGALQVDDFRIIFYWIPLFIVTLFIYFRNSYDLKNNFYYEKNYYKIILISSVIYFCFYLIMNLISYIFYGNPYDIQDLYWMGTSGAFNISSLFFLALYKLWLKEDFKTKSKFIFLIPFYMILQSTNDSRLGFLYLFCFVFFVLIKQFQKKNFVNLIAFLIIILSSHLVIDNSMGFINHKLSLSEGDYITKNIITNANELRKYDGRKFELDVGKSHYEKSSLKEKIFGSGWYSSRITIVPQRNKMIEELNKVTYEERVEKYLSGESKINPILFYKKTVVSMQGIVAIILDSGLLGLAFLIIIILRNLYLINIQKCDFVSKLFTVSILSIHLLCLYIGYPLVSIPYFLFILPKGLIFNKI